MGNSRSSAADWGATTASYSGKTRDQIFTQKAVHQTLDPVNIKVRESVDSDTNPRSTPIIIGVDETGSMGMLAETIIKHGLKTMMIEIYDRRPVSDPHICCLALGDAFSDRSPLQATQFEASIVLADQVEKFHIEGNGGGNGGESYLLAHYFAAFKTKTDSMLKRQKKGYLFTIGDEAPHPELTKQQIKQFVGDDVDVNYSAKDLLEAACQSYEVFHLIVKPAYPEAVTKWRELLGERAIMVDDHEKLAEVIVSTIEVIEGRDADSVAKSWSGDTSLVVANAIRGLTNNAVAVAAAGGPVKI